MGLPVNSISLSQLPRLFFAFDRRIRQHYSCKMVGEGQVDETLDDGAVLCRISCKIGETWIEKADVGGASGQADAGDRRKAALSDETGGG